MLLLVVVLAACGRTGEEGDPAGPGGEPIIEVIDAEALFISLAFEPEFVRFEPGLQGDVAQDAVARLRNVGTATAIFDGFSLEGDAGFQFGAFEAPESLAPGAEVEIPIRYVPDGAVEGWARLRAEAALPDGALDEVAVLPLSLSPFQCPEVVIRCTDSARELQVTDAFGTQPLETVRCRAEVPGAGSWQRNWTLLRSAFGSDADLVRDEEVGGIELFADASGTYLFELDLVREDGARPCPPQFFRLLVFPDADLLVQLTWSRAPGGERSTGQGMDLDLHLLHPNGGWGDSQWDVHFRNSNQAWGGGEVTLDRDDVNGYGPENISLRQPVAGTRYRVGVHYYAQNGTAWATVRVFVRGELRAAFTDRRMTRTGQFWEVADIIWDENRPRIEIQDRLNGGMCNARGAGPECIRR